MGFFDSMKKGLDDESMRLQDVRGRSSYQTLKAQDQEHHDKLNAQSDGTLLNKYKAPYTSEDEKAMILSILQERGYRKVGKEQG